MNTEKQILKNVQKQLNNRTTTGKQFTMKQLKKLIRDNRDSDKNTMNQKEMMDRCNKVMFTQMSAYEGLKIFKERALAALVKEFKQLDEGVFPGKPVVAPRNKKDLTNKELVEAFLHSEMQPKDGNYQHVILRGRYVEIMCEVNKEYEKFVEYENGQKFYI